MKKTILSSITLFLCTVLLAQNSAMLKMNLEKNKVYRLRSSTEQNVIQTINGNQQNVESNVDYCISLKMIDATNDFMIVETHFDTLITKTNTMGKTLNFSSTSEGNMASSETGDIISCIMNRLSKSAVYVKIDYTGKPVEIVNLKMLSDMILKDTSSITLTGPTAAAVKTQASSIVSDSNLKNMIGSFTWYLPDKEVSEGENWEINQQINSGGMLLDIKTSLKLDQISGNNAGITLESKIKAPENAVPIKSGPATVTYDNLQGTSKSKLVVDIRTGLAVENSSETHIMGNLGVSGPGFSMEMPMDIIGKSNVKTLQ